MNGGTAHYTFDGGTGPCTGATLSGSFTAETPVTATNTVRLTVTVDSVGSYFISTNTMNGISFSGSGTFTTTGVQNITLTASGTPATAGTYNFILGDNGCSFSVTVIGNTGGASGTAVYSFNGGTSSCTDAQVNGTFTEGTASSAGNTVVLNVMVDTVGTYTIYTSTVNGITFSGSGTFTATGAQTVTLTASGTPISSGTFAFAPDYNGCSFDVTVESASTGGGGSDSFLKCKINGTLTTFNKDLIGYYVPPPAENIPYSISVQGKNSDIAGSAEELWVSISNPTSPTTGTYNNRTFSMGVTARASQLALYPNGFSSLQPYWGSSAFNANTFTVNITSVSTSGAAGKFSGTIYENVGLGPAAKQVTEGEFKISF